MAVIVEVERKADGTLTGAVVVRDGGEAVYAFRLPRPGRVHTIARDVRRWLLHDAQEAA